MIDYLPKEDLTFGFVGFLLLMDAVGSKTFAELFLLSSFLS